MGKCTAKALVADEKLHTALIDFMASVGELPQGLKIADYFDYRFDAINQAARKEYAGI